MGQVGHVRDILQEVFTTNTGFVWSRTRLCQAQKNSHDWGNACENLFVETVKLLLGEANGEKMRRISLSSDAIQRSVSDMLEDVKDQVINEMKASPMFHFQVDDSTHVTSCAQLLVFVRYIHSGDIKAEFLFCEKLQTTVHKCRCSGAVNLFYSVELQSKYVCGICTHGASAMTGSRLGFHKKVENLLLKQKVHAVSFTDVRLLAELYLLLWKMCWIPR